MKFQFILIVFTILIFRFLVEECNAESSKTHDPIWALTPAIPSTSSSFLDAVNVKCNLIQLSWTNGNGKGRLIIARKEQSVNAIPGNKINYIANANYGEGENLGDDNYVVYKGASNNVTIKIDFNSTYYFAIYEYNENNNNLYFLTSYFPTTSISINKQFPQPLLRKDTLVCSQNAITLCPGKDFASYLWSNGSTNHSITLNSFGNTGTISNTVTVFNDNGCSSKATTQVTFKECNESEQQFKRKNFDIYPNPNNGLFKVKINNSGITFIRVFSVSGAILYTERLLIGDELNFKNIDFTSLNEGIYFLQIENEEFFETKKIIIQK